jgi:hypothetical protein
MGLHRTLDGTVRAIELGSLLAREPGKDEATYAFVAAAAALAQRPPSRSAQRCCRRSGRAASRSGNPIPPLRVRAAFDASRSMFRLCRRGYAPPVQQLGTQEQEMLRKFRAAFDDSTACEARAGPEGIVTPLHSHQIAPSRLTAGGAGVRGATEGRHSC